MSVRSILKMGDVRLLQQARPVEDFTAPWLSTLLADLHDTMAAPSGVRIGLINTVAGTGSASG